MKGVNQNGGLCECGCGQPAPIAPFSNKTSGYVKGQPKRFVVGHNGRLPPEERRRRRVEQVRAYNRRNRERRKEQYAADPEKAKRQAQEWAEKNRGRRREICREYAKRHPHVGKASRANRRARRSQAGGKVSPKEVLRLMDLQKAACGACGVDLNASGSHLDHIVPLARGGTNTDSNLQLLCPPCNLSKGAKTMEEWLGAA